MFMVRAVVLVTTSPGMVDKVAEAIRGIGVKDVLTVAGRVDVVVFIEGVRDDVSSKIRRIFKTEGVETTETLWEVEE